MPEARYRLEGLDPAWALLAELAWLSPRRYGELPKRRPVTGQAAQAKFDASFEGDGDVADLAWFPAWVLTEKGRSGPLAGRNIAVARQCTRAGDATLDRTHRLGAAGPPP